MRGVFGVFVVEREKNRERERERGEKKMTQDKAKICLKSAGGIGLAIAFLSLRFAASRNSRHRER